MKTLVHPRTLRQRYVQAMAERLRYKKQMQSAQIDYKRLRTDMSRGHIADFIQRRLGQ